MIMNGTLHLYNIELNDKYDPAIFEFEIEWC